jgi:hypothetical protein
MLQAKVVNLYRTRQQGVDATTFGPRLRKVAVLRPRSRWCYHVQQCTQAATTKSAGGWGGGEADWNKAAHIWCLNRANQ